MTMFDIETKLVLKSDVSVKLGSDDAEFISSTIGVDVG